MNNRLNETELFELDYKLILIRDFLVLKGGRDYEYFNIFYPNSETKPCSNIVEYLDDVVCLIKKLKKSKNH